MPVAQYEQLGACFTLKTVNGGTGNLFATLQYACIQEHADNGISIVAKAAPAAWDAVMKADAYTEYAEYRFNANRRKVPVWATHVILTFNLFARRKMACFTSITPALPPCKANAGS